LKLKRDVKGTLFFGLPFSPIEYSKSLEDSSSAFSGKLVIVGDHDSGKKTLFNHLKAKPYCQSSPGSENSPGSFYCTFPDSRTAAITIECPELNQRYTVHTFKNSTFSF
jgi:hypothetical protein